MNNDLLKEYSDYLANDQKLFSKTKKRIQTLSILRFLAFVAIILTIFFWAKIGNTTAVISIVTAVILFFYWIKEFVSKEKKKKLYENLIEINQKELHALSEDYSLFKSGVEFKDTDHPFSNDLDLFGEGSIFQFINRTTTQLGQKRLAHLLKSPLTDIGELEQRQEALSELSKHARWRQYFAAKGQTHDEDDFKLLKQLAETEDPVNWVRVKWLIILLPMLSVSLLVLCLWGIISWSFFLTSLLVNGFVLYSYRKIISSYYYSYGKQSKLLQSYVDLLLLIEKKDFISNLLIDLKQELYSDQKSASQVFIDLKKMMGRFDYRANIIFAMLAEPIFLWDLICVYQLNKWHKKYNGFFLQCFDIIAEFDALSSFANLNHNNPEWTQPSFMNDEFHYVANDLAHPLIKSQKRIGNSFQIHGDGRIAIITGANMAGKSTFLRALGVNLVLALNGCRVCASWFSIRPVALYSNMRTTDNLTKDESYFFAELLRLQNMLERIRKGEKMFLLIDEMLKGTNSHDKLSGSRELIKQLIALKTNGVVATHDLELTRMDGTYPNNIQNLCLDVRLHNDELVFDYKIREGVTSTMNASFLMKKMGIIS